MSSEQVDVNDVTGLEHLSVADAQEIQSYAWPDVWASRLGLSVESHDFDVAGREYQREILRDESQVIICPKGAQMGLTTVFLVKACHSIIQRCWTVLYLLPLKAGSIPFVQRRIDPMIDSNPQLAAEFKRVDNRNMKVTLAGATWYIRGTNIHSELREVPADVLVLDERDVANEEFLGDAYARLDGSSVQRSYELSTPTIEGHGVYGDDGWKASDQMQWWVPCPACGSMQIINWEENVLPFLGDTIEECEQSCRCSHCQHPFTDDERAAANASGEWVPANSGASIRGYHISQLNSPTKSLAHPKFGVLVNWFKGQTDSGKLKDFYTLGLGLPYASPGDRFSLGLLDRSRRDYESGSISRGQLCIGVDQGHDTLHVTIDVVEGATTRTVSAFTVTGKGDKKKWQVLEEEVLQRYSSWVCVCDAHPDKEDCEGLSKKYSGRFFMGYEKDRPEQAHTAVFETVKWGEPAKVTIDRTMAFDSYIKSFIDGRHHLPRDARELGEYMPKKPYNGFYHHHLQMVRVKQADASDRLVARWVNGTVKARRAGGSKPGNRPDHFMHSGMFSLIASMHDAPLIIPASVGNLFRAAGGLVSARG